jgi:3-methyladenine DNA glycosylase AlkD
MGVGSAIGAVTTPGDRRAIVEVSSAIFNRLQSTPQKTADIRRVRREFSKQIAGWPAGSVVDLAMALLERSEFVCRFVAYELVGCHREALTNLRAAQVERLGRGLDSWGAVDTFSLFIAGPVWRDSQIDEAVVHAWAASDDRWWRRAALVATVPLNLKSRGGAGDAERTLDVCRLLISDRDDMVVKALSWALRALAVRDRKSVSAFVASYRGQLANRVNREVQNKLATGRKTPGAQKRS